MPRCAFSYSGPECYCSQHSALRAKPLHSPLMTVTLKDRSSKPYTWSNRSTQGTCFLSGDDPASHLLSLLLRRPGMCVENPEGAIGTVTSVQPDENCPIKPAHLAWLGRTCERVVLASASGAPCACQSASAKSNLTVQTIIRIPESRFYVRFACVVRVSGT